MTDLSSKHAIPTPFFLFDEAAFRANITRFREALAAHHDKVVIGYSIKTNYVPGIVEVARDLGCYAEVVSRMELELAERLDFAHGQMIFNGPMKTADDMSMCIRLGGYLHLDSLDQVRMFLTLPEDQRRAARIGLRINVDLSAGLKDMEKIARGGVVPRFGLPMEAMDDAMRLLAEDGVPIRALHGHASSSDRKPENYAKIATLLLEVCKANDLADIEMLDIGGGFSGTLPDIWEVADAPSFTDYADAIFAPLKGDAWFEAQDPAVAIEPGMSVIADCISYVTSVVARKTVGGQHILGVDGNYFDVRPTLHRKPLPADVTRADGAPAEATDETYLVAGSTCMERDLLLEDFAAPADIAVGDRIEIGNVGAYTMVLSPHFINYAGAIIGQRPDGSLHVLRRAQGFDDFFCTYEFGG